MRPKTKQALDTILDCMSGADGGVAFVRFKAAIERWDDEASTEPRNPASASLVDVVTKFARLIDVCNQTNPPPSKDRTHGS